MNSRIKALNTLHKIEERALEDLARSLNAAQSARANAEGRIAHLEARAATEARCTDMESLPYLGRFMATLRREQARENVVIQELSNKIDTLRDEVMAHYSAGRSWQVLSERLSDEITTAQAHAAEAAIEDITSARFLAKSRL